MAEVPAVIASIVAKLFAWLAAWLYARCEPAHRPIARGLLALLVLGCARVATGAYLATGAPPREGLYRLAWALDVAGWVGWYAVAVWLVVVALRLQKGATPGASPVREVHPGGHFGASRQTGPAARAALIALAAAGVTVGAAWAAYPWIAGALTRRLEWWIALAAARRLCR